MKNWRYRLARRLLGYRPHRLGDTDGVYIVVIDGPATVTMAAKTFEMDMKSGGPRIDPAADWDAYPPVIGYITGRREASFSGTL